MVQSTKILAMLIVIVISLSIVTYRATEINGTMAGAMTVNASDIVTSEANQESVDFGVILIGSFTLIILFVIAIKHKIRFL